MVTVMVAVVAVAWIGIIVVIAWVEIGITVVGLVIRIVPVEIIGRVFAIIISIAPAPVRRLDNRAAVYRRCGSGRYAGDRRSRGGHCPESQRQATAGCTEPMLHFHGLSSLVGGDAYAPTHLVRST